ncbi:hypothetical protein SteCoe_24080 [Stentor coeruleus]|uniref:CCT domain-containing protein n=1 Tax=Stentor coeruleus TaxID=5963 RepID=A0A1R2BIE0_9CILI|nr:hypothetical protein SteCoe_24080 [Stentor coeruleus]
MLGYPEDMPCISEHELDLIQNDVAYTVNRKSSFVDLLSYGKICNEPSIEESQDLDNLLNGPFLLEINDIKSENFNVQLYIDEFTELNSLGNNFVYTDLLPNMNLKIFPKPGLKYIGPLTIHERRLKIEKYLEKKKKRTWIKKIHYDCRKRVADNRLRVKGRFVTRSKVNDLFKDQDFDG